MTASDSIRYRLALADGFLREAQQDRELERWRSCVDHSQLFVENAGKALLLLFGVSPKTHDPGRQLANLIAAGVPPEPLRIGLAEIASDLQALGPAEHVLTDYGDEATETLPWDLFSQDSAVQALALAERVLDHTRRLLTLQEKSARQAPAEPAAE
jgi:HEPN domain-containing protein